MLDLDDEGESIFNRKKPLCEKTLERIYAGMVKFVAGGKESFLVKYNSMSQSNKYVAPGIDEPCPTVACQNRLGVAKIQFLSKNFSGDPESKNIGIDKPAGTVTTIDHHSFVTAFYGNGFNRSIEEPAPTATGKDRFALVTTQFYQNEYGSGGHTSSLDNPNPAVMTNPKQKLVSVKQYLMNPQFSSAGGSIDNPCFTLIARMDKMPPYLISTKEGVGIAIYDNDSPMTVVIKEFMAMYGIVDICMRMLKVEELKQIMGFPKDYILVGTQSEQKKYIGNAVEVNMARSLCEALSSVINKQNMKIHLVLKSRWYDMILSGEKKEEYRLHTPYWDKRIWRCKEKIDSIVFHRGYTNIKHERECRNITKGIGKPEWGAPEQDIIILKLGKIINQ